MNDYQVTFEHISKTFFGIKALDNITLSVRKGTILGLIGQNGAGKSTLMNILGGVITPDAGGHMHVNGQPYHPRRPADAKAHGIAFIHQELNLFTNLNIAENLFIDEFPKRRLLGIPVVDYRRIYRETSDVLESMGLRLLPRTLIDDLSPGERQLVEIAKALHSDASTIIFDEPTTSLTPREIEQLFRIMTQLRADDKTLIYISHILTDVLDIADDVAILRDGKLVAAGPKEDFTINRMISLMIGRDLEHLFPKRTNQPQADVLLEVDGLSQRGIVENIRFQLHRGEIMGIFGLMGSGRSELARILFGLDEFERGSIILRGERLISSSPRHCIRRGMAFVTENRRTEGLMMEATIAENIALSSLEKWAHTNLQLVDQVALTEKVGHVASRLAIKSGSITRHKAKTLSGGNQQKVVIAKWLMSEPSVFILDEPTRGIDVGAKYEIYDIINQLATNGNSIMFISSELDELIGMCDRILVMNRGEICGEFIGPQYDKQAILGAAFRQGNGATNDYHNTQHTHATESEQPA